MYYKCDEYIFTCQLLGTLCSNNHKRRNNTNMNIFLIFTKSAEFIFNIDIQKEVKSALYIEIVMPKRHGDKVSCHNVRCRYAYFLQFIYLFVPLPHICSSRSDFSHQTTGDHTNHSATNRQEMVVKPTARYPLSVRNGDITDRYTAETAHVKLR